jgi:hypothetical protein
LNSYGQIIGTEYISDLVEKGHEHAVHKHGNALLQHAYNFKTIGYNFTWVAIDWVLFICILVDSFTFIAIIKGFPPITTLSC